MSIKKKVLFVATVDSHIELFHVPYLKMLRNMGYEVHVATDSKKMIDGCDKKIKIPIARSPMKLSNLIAIRELREVIKREKYNIIHCHTPMGGVVARLAAKSSKKRGTKIIYTAHGFHFYKGSPFYYWLVFYPIEKYLAKYTDVLITINDEDYSLAKKKFIRRCSDIKYVPGVGVDKGRFEKKISEHKRHKLRESLGLKDDDIVLICVGRLDKNKNQGFLIDVLARLIKDNFKYKLLLVGLDELNGEYQKKAEGFKDNVIFAGFRKDIPDLFKISNIALSASKREGLPVNVIEAAMSGLPVVMTNCRGCEDIKKRYNGICVAMESVDDFALKIKNIEKKGQSEELDYFSNISIMEKMRKVYDE